MKNILNITVRADIGGGPIHMNELIHNLGLKNSKLFIACPFSGSIYTDFWKENNKTSKLLEIPFRRFSIKSFRQLIKFIKTNNIHIVHSHGKGAGLYSRCLKIVVPGIKVIHTFHGINIFEKGFSKKLKNIYLERILKKWTTAFICVSNGEKELAISYLNISKENISVIHNGVKDTFNNVDKTIAKAVISFSRFSFEKNMNASYEIAKKANSNIQFNWIGDGEDFELIKEKKGRDKLNNLNLLGFKKSPQNYLVAGSIYLSTSRHEGLPLSLIEAEAYGIPIIATNVVGNNEVVIDGFNGFLFEENDYKLAVEKIELLFKNPILYKKMSQNARADYLKRFTLEKMIVNTQKIYDTQFS